jgi:hypothetical protein
VEARLFLKAPFVQAAALAVPFVALALTLDRSFFESWGWLVGPALWMLAAVVTARILSLPYRHVLVCALAGGVAAAIALLAASHTAGMVAGLLVFAASCAAIGATGFEPAIFGLKGRRPRPLDHAPGKPRV